MEGTPASDVPRAARGRRSVQAVSVALADGVGSERPDDAPVECDAETHAGVRSLLSLAPQYAHRLFPPAGDNGGRLAWWWAVVVVVIGATLSLGRLTDPAAIDTLWAEDGEIFLAEALARSPTEAFLSPYAGYLHAVPRLAAEAAAALPVEASAALLTIGAALMTALLALLVFVSSAGHLRSTAVRGVLAAAMVMVPVGLGEVFANVANLHWFLMFASFWVLLWRVERPAPLTVGALVVFLAALSDPLTGLLLPLALARMWALRSWREHVFAWALGAGLAVQAVVILLQGPGRELGAAVAPVRIAGWYAYKVVVGAVLGERFTIDAQGTAAGLFLAVCLVAVLALASVAFRTRSRRRTPIVPVALAGSVVFYVAPVVLTGIAAPRYAVVPALLLYTALAGIVDPLVAARPRGHLPVLPVTAGLVLVVVWAVNWPLDVRADGPFWTPALGEAVAECEPGVQAVIPIAPEGTPEAWEVVVDCAKL